MKGLIVALVSWWSGLQHKVIARLLWLVLWVVITFDFVWFIYRIKPDKGLMIIVSLVIYFFLTELILGMICFLSGDKECGFLAGIFTIEDRDDWMNSPL